MKQAVQKAKPVKDFCESVKEFKLLDKILPDFNLLTGIQVLISTNPNLISPEKSSSKSDQSFGTIDEVKGNTSAIVKLKNGELKEFSLRKLKFLARAYTCNAEDVDMSNVPSEHQFTDASPKDRLILVQEIHV